MAGSFTMSCTGELKGTNIRRIYRKSWGHSSMCMIRFRTSVCSKTDLSSGATRQQRGRGGQNMPREPARLFNPSRGRGGRGRGQAGAKRYVLMYFRNSCKGKKDRVSSDSGNSQCRKKGRGTDTSRIEHSMASWATNGSFNRAGTYKLKDN